NIAVRAAGDRIVAIFDMSSQAATEAHSICTALGPSVLSHNNADWLVTSPTAMPCGRGFTPAAARGATLSAKGLPGGSPSRDADTQLITVGIEARRKKSRQN